jgi:hypothetical protein
MLRKLCLALGLFFLVSLSAHAQDQDKVEIFGGYSYLRLDTSPAPSVNLNGWEASAQYKVTSWLGGVADFSGDYGSIAGVGTQFHTFLFGPQVSFPARISPFAHVLVGGAHISGGGNSDTAFASAIGVGIDAKITDRFSWRLIQGDYLISRFSDHTQNNARVSTGIVFRF